MYLAGSFHCKLFYIEIWPSSYNVILASELSYFPLFPYQIPLKLGKLTKTNFSCSSPENFISNAFYKDLTS